MPGSVQAVRKATQKASSTCELRLDMIGYRLLMLIKNTNLGTAVVEEIAGWVDYVAIHRKAKDPPEEGSSAGVTGGNRPRTQLREIYSRLPKTENL